MKDRKHSNLCGCNDCLNDELERIGNTLDGIISLLKQIAKNSQKLDRCSNVPGFVPFGIDKC